MILLVLRSGKEIPVRGEKWNEVGTVVMGKIHVTDAEGHSLTIRAEAVDVATEYPDAEVKKRLEWKKAADETKRQEAETKAAEQAEYMRRHPFKTWLGSVKKRLS